MLIRQSEPRDDDAIWRILEPTFRAGETYPVPRDISREDALAYWRDNYDWAYCGGRCDYSAYERFSYRGFWGNYGYAYTPWWSK